MQRHEHEKKEYVRECKNPHAQFAGGFKLRVGSIYGRIWVENRNQYVFFVCTKYVPNKRGLYTWVKVGAHEWEKVRLANDGRIAGMISDYIAKNGVPVLKRYNLPRQPKAVCVEFHGKKYQDLTEKICQNQDVKVSKELKGIAPSMPSSLEYDSTQMKPSFTQYGVMYAGKLYGFFGLDQAEKFCEEKGISDSKIEQMFISDKNFRQVHNEYSYLAIYKDMDRQVETEEAGYRLIHKKQAKPIVKKVNPNRICIKIRK